MGERKPVPGSQDLRALQRGGRLIGRVKLEVHQDPRLLAVGAVAQHRRRFRQRRRARRQPMQPP